MIKMKKRSMISVLIISVLIALSCAGTNKRLRKTSRPAEKVNTETEKDTKSSSAEIKEIKEKVIAVDPQLPDPHLYFVIIGSFRNQDNAKKYQEQILNKGFSSTLLKNESGLYRVSVLSTNEIEIARDDIHRIRGVFPEHYDTWLLVQKK
jgi:cell division protein FtsN